MDFTGAGTAIMLALAAVLWFLYLLPSWMRRREFLATERNATRLQRAIRVLAETAEAPAELRVEANAREVARTERLLAQERRRVDAATRAEVHAAELRARAAETQALELERVARRAATLSAPAVARAATAAAAPDVTPVLLAFARLRRARRVAGLLMLAAVAVGVVQLWLMATTGVVVGSWVVVAGCVTAAGVSVRLQRRIADRARSLAVAPEARARRTTSKLIDADVRHEQPARAWTPVPVPKPLYLERGEAPRVPIVPPVAAEQLLRAAAEEAERALAAAHAEPEVVAFRPREGAQVTAAAPAPAPSRFASMGRIDDVDAARPDLDEVLRRRRSAG
jgi:hypothetical protein